MVKVNLDVPKGRKKLFEKYAKLEEVPEHYRTKDIVSSGVPKSRYEEVYRSRLFWSNVLNISSRPLEEDYFEKLRQRELTRKELDRIFITRGEFEKYKGSVVSDWSEWADETTKIMLHVCKKVSQDTAQITLKEQKIPERIATLEKYVALQEFPDILFRTLALGGCGISVAGILLAIITQLLILIPPFVVAGAFCYHTYRRIGRTR